MGENGEAAAAIQEIQAAGPAVQAIRVVTETRNLRNTAVRNPRRNERRGKSLAGMARRY